MLPRNCFKFTFYSRFIYLKYYLRSDIKLVSCNYKSLGYIKSDRPIHSINSSNIQFCNGKEKDNFNNGETCDLLEKYVIGLSTSIHQKYCVYTNYLMLVLDKAKEANFLKETHGLILINCCTQLLVTETPGYRLELVKKVWNIVRSRSNLTVNHYNELLKVYIDNNRTLNFNSFIQNMEPVIPNFHTYTLLMRALAEVGDIKQASELVMHMKTQGLSATEDIFHSLIICQGKNGKLEDAIEILNTMTSLNLKHTVDTYTAVVRAYAWNKNNELLLNTMTEAVKNGIKFGETHIMDIVKTLVLMENYELVPKILQYLPEKVLKLPTINPYMQNVATQMVYQNQPLVALDIYKCLALPAFGPKDDTGLHGRSLVRDCVKAGLSSSVIVLVARELMSSGRNPVALQEAAKCALVLGKTPLALDLLMCMKQLGLPLRPHYFWPILVSSSKSLGEKGVMITLSTMVTGGMDVKPDYDTLLGYVLPHVSFTSPQNLMKKLLETGLTVQTVLTPMMVTLLKTGQVRAASEICEIYKGKVDAEKVIPLLAKGYLISSDVTSTIHILQDVTAAALDKSKNWVAMFLTLCMTHKKVKLDLTLILDVVKALQSTQLRISAAAFDNCISNTSQSSDKVKENFRNELFKITDENLEDGDIYIKKIPRLEETHEQSLKCHLIELESKGGNTRGVLRKLLLQYCKEGNLPAAKEILEKCIAEEVVISAGMRAAIFDLYVKLGEIDHAELAYVYLANTWPKFILDEFKVIDFATLMVYNSQIDKAINLITQESKKRSFTGGKAITKNCWRLLDATAATGTPKDVERVLNALVSTGLCQPSNKLLGPLVRAYLKSNNTEEAVDKFVALAGKYKKTPLKHELLCTLLRDMGENDCEDKFIENERSNDKRKQLVYAVLRAVKAVHGAADVQLSVITALAEVGYKKTLRNLFLDPQLNIHPDALMRCCEHFAQDKKVSPLVIIAECVKDLGIVKTENIYEMVLDIYHRDDNCPEAISLWHKMQEAEVKPSLLFVRKLLSICEINQKSPPPELAALLV